IVGAGGRRAVARETGEEGFDIEVRARVAVAVEVRAVAARTAGGRVEAHHASGVAAADVAAADRGGRGAVSVLDTDGVVATAGAAAADIGGHVAVAELDVVAAL